MTIISPVFFTGDFIKMLAMEYFWTSIFVVICLLVCCGYYIRKHGEETGQHGVTVAVYMIMLMLMCMLFSFVALRDEQNDYGDTYESVIGPASYDLIKYDNITYVYERF